MVTPAGRFGVSATDPRLPDDVVERLLDHLVVTGPRERVEITAPASERAIGRVPAGDASDVSEAARRARAAQPAWAARPVEDRARVLRRLARLVLSRQAEVLDLIQLETGKTRTDALEEVLDVATVASYYARTATAHLRPRRREGALPLLTTTRELRHPKGVVGIIAPWNYPLTMVVTDALAALAAGNACVVKPAPTTPFTALWAAELLRHAGLPADLFGVVTGPGDVVGGALIDEVDAVAFTGSTATGRRVAARAGERLVSASLELGGKNAMLVLDDADLDAAVDGAVRGCFASAGQLCVATERLYVHEAVADAFTERFLARTRALQLSCELTWGGEVGSLVSRQQLATVRRHVADAVERGATVLVGGATRPDVGPLVHEPTVLTGVTDAMEVHGAETFGPVVSLERVADDAEALACANASPYGLNASIWTRDRRRGARVAARLRAGTVNVNEAYAAAWGSVDAPMGGVGDSGLGRRHGREGLHRFTEPQTIAWQRVLPTTRIPWLADEAGGRVLTAAVDLLGRRPRRRRGRA